VSLISTFNTVIKSRRRGWVGRVARMGEMKNAFKILFGKPEGKRLPGRHGVDRRLTLK
jgi:hypothetical protein